MTYNFSVKGLWLSCSNSKKIIVSDSVKYHMATFEFSDIWQGYNKTVVFTNSKTSVSKFQVLGDNNECEIPWETITNDGNLIVCVEGISDNGSIIWTKMNTPLLIVKSDKSESEEPLDPTPSEYQQIIELTSQAVKTAQNAENIANDIKEQADSGAFKGDKGDSATISVGETITAEAGTPASVTNVGTENDAILKFTIPRGEKGEQGIQGLQGEKGDKGDSATISVGETITAEAGTPASVTNVGTENDAILKFTIPKGSDVFTYIKPLTQNNPYIIQNYGYYYTTSVGWVQIGTNQQDISETLSIEFYKPFYCATNTIILFGFSNKYSDESRAFTYIVTIGDDINISIYPTSGGSKEAFNYSLNEIFQNFLAFVNLFRPIIDEGQNALNKIVVVDSYDSSHGVFTFSVRDADSELSNESTFAVQNKVVTAALAQKKAVPAISTPSGSSITLENNSEYRLQATASLNLTLPESIPDDYECSLVFESGETATVLGYAANSIKFVGDDCDAEGDFIPQANKGYEVNIKNLGYDRIVARVGAF